VQRGRRTDSGSRRREQREGNHAHRRSRLTTLALWTAGEAVAAIRQLNATIDPTQETSCALPSDARGAGSLTVDDVTRQYTYQFTFGRNAPTYNDGLLQQGSELSSHIHGPAAPGATAGVVVALPNGSPKVGAGTFTPTQLADLLNGLYYVNIHSTNCAGGEIRGQLLLSTAAPALPGWSSLALGAALALAVAFALRSERA
jgi:hypothetical protein